MERVSDERLEEQRGWANAWTLARDTSQQWFLDLEASLVELQQRRARRCETCQFNNAMKAHESSLWPDLGTCSELMKPYANTFLRLKPNGFCWKWQPGEGTDGIPAEN